MMPINIPIPAKIRAALYILGAVGSVAVAYGVDKDWLGQPEVTAWAGIVAIISLLAAAKTQDIAAEDTATAGIVAGPAADFEEGDPAQVWPDDPEHNPFPPAA